MTLVIFLKKRLISALYNVRYIPFSLIRLIFRLYNEIKGQSPKCICCFTIYFGPGRTMAGNETNHTRPEKIRRRNNRRKHQREVAMFTHRNNEKDNERGALMIEAIALLGLMTMMSPMVVRQTADRTAEMEEVAIAGQMKEIKDALSNWIEANYQEKAKEFSAAGDVDKNFSVSAADLAPYLPATYLNGNNFRGNKLVDGFDVGVRAQCTEVAKDDGSECTVANGCYSLTNGAIAAIPAGAKCSRYKMTGVVLSKSDNNEEIDDRRASRIASMIGADGGYMRTKKLVESLYGGSSGGSGSTPDGATAEMQKIVGSQGMWEGDVTKYIPGISTNIGGKVAATTIFSSGFSGDYLYRKKVDGLPGANSMFTDLDMGGATECEGDGCHKINNAGGLEVVGGKILIRSQNTDDDQGISSGNSFAKIALATDNSHLKVDNQIYLETGRNSSNRISYLALDAAEGVQIGAQDGIHMQASNNSSTLNLLSNELYAGAPNILLEADDNIDVTSGNNIDIYSGNIDMAANYVDIEGKYTNLIGQRQVLMGIGNNAKNPGLIMNEVSYFLQSRNTSINGISNQIELTTGDPRSHTYGRPAAQLDFYNKTSFTVNKSFLRGGVNNNSSSFRLNANQFDVNVGGNASTNSNFVVQPTAIVALINYGNRISAMAVEPNMFRIALNSEQGIVNSEHELFMQNKRFIINVYNNTSPTRDTVAYLASVYSNRAKLSVNADTGSTSGSTSTATNARVTISNSMDADSGISPYYTHNGDTEYHHFRVDPSYMSVMNDIKITSRGGARLSEALPNYILKGIYELSNSYGSGPWPCGNGNCSFTVPYYTRKALGLSSGGWEFNCGGTGTNGSGSHPIVNGGGTCTGKDGNSAYSTGDVVTFNYEKSSYTECSSGSFCWAHPFLGAVPAPGRKVSESGEANKDGLAAYDEGVCPDGYQAVLTVTPTVFELGKVQFVNSEKRPSDAAVAYNPGWQNYANSNIADVTGLMQMSTKLGLIVEPITSGSTLYGWKIAMGTVTPTSTNTAGYIWNAGGIPANSWSAIAHTYCYFNPDRFEMPNMVIKDNMIQTADNPSL